jgi:hypothetical protein
VALIALGDGDDEPEVRVDHALLRLAVAALDALRELDLLLRCQQRIAAGLVEEELQRIRRRVGEITVDVGCGRGLRTAAVVLQVDPAPLDLLVKALHVVVVELERLSDLVELGQLDAALFFAVCEESF